MCRFYRIAIWVQAIWRVGVSGGVGGCRWGGPQSFLFTFRMEALKMTGQIDLTKLLFSVQFKDNVRLLAVAK